MFGLIAPVTAQQNRPWRLRQIAAIGSVNDPDHTQVGEVRIAATGEILVSQARESLIRVFDSRGRLVRTIGRRGEGPGEFASISSIGVLGSRLYVSDNRLKRISWFSISGQFLYSKRRTSPGIRLRSISYLPTVPQTLLPDGRAVAVPGAAIPYPPPPKPQPSRVPVLLLDSTDRVIDTLTWNVRLPPALAVGSPKVPIPNPFMFSPPQTVAVDGSVMTVDRVEKGAAGRLMVKKRMPGGKTAFTTTITYKPAAVSAEAVRSAAADVLFGLRRAGILPISNLTVTDIQRHLRASGVVPHTLPPATRIAATQDGSTWLRRESGGDRVVWNVIDRTGVTRATVVMLRDETVVAFDGSALVTLQFDEFDVPLLRVYRVQL